MNDLQGLWARSLLAFPDGRRDVTTAVRWLQAREYYADLRQPEGRPDFSGVACLRQLNAPQVAWLSRQEGFAGALALDGGFFEWRRDLDFQPPSDSADAGRLWFEDDLLIEEGRDLPYIEHWRRQPCGAGPCAAAKLLEIGGDRLGFIIRVGDLFMYARSRAAPTSWGQSLAACVEGVAGLAEAQDLVDCEISFGRIEAGGWLILNSSLPFKEGLLLRASQKGDRIVTSDITPAGGPTQISWLIDDLDGVVADLAGAG